MKRDAAEQAAFRAELPDYPDWSTISNLGIGTVNGWGDTPLHLAAVQGRISIMEALVRHGADINARGEQGCTPQPLPVERTDGMPLLPVHVSHVSANIRIPTRMKKRLPRRAARLNQPALQQRRNALPDVARVMLDIELQRHMFAYEESLLCPQFP